MQTVDSNIPLGVQPPNLISPLDAYGKAMSLKSLQADTQAKNLQLMQGMQSLKDQQQLSQIAADPANLDPATGGLNSTALTKITNPLLRQKLNDTRLAQLKDKADIEYKTSEAGEKADKRKTDALHSVMESAYSVYEDTLSRTGNKDAATDAFNKAQQAGYEDIKTTGRGGFGKDVNFRMLSPEDVGAKLITHKERVDEASKKAAADRGEETPFIKETNYVEKLRHQLAELPANDPGRTALMSQIQKVEKHIARLDAPAHTSVTLERPKESNLTGEDYLKSLPPSEQRLVKGIAENKINPNSLSTKGGHRERILAQVAQYSDGKYEQQDYGNISNAERGFNTGKQGQSVRAFNVALEHLDTLGDLSNALKNKDTQLLNRAGNAWASATGSSAPTDFNAAKQLVADEVVKAIVGSGGGVHDREEAAKTISAQNSPEQLAGVIDTYKKLFGGQIKGLEQQYKSSTGKEDFREKYLTDRGRQAAAHEPVAKPEGGDVAPALDSRVVGKTKWRGHTWVKKDGKYGWSTD